MLFNRSTGIIILAAVVMAAVSPTFAQGPAKGRVESMRDEALEIQAKHNLDVARWYFTKRKAYEGTKDRLQEIIDTYPEFSRMDEVLFLMGEVHLKLGKKDAAHDYFAKLLKDYSGSEFAKRAQSRLDELQPENK
jgi:outer membrane protein assembly factor BamD (BamD/ComL family)